MDENESLRLGQRYKILRTNDMLMEGLGKVPPQAIDLEEAVLGAILLEKPAYGKVADLIDSDDFYKENHQLIYKAIADLIDTHSPIDLLLVTNRLREKGQLELVGGASYITELTSKVNSAEHIEQHALVIKQSSIKRKLIKLSAEIYQKAYEDTVDPFDLLDETSKELNEIHKFTEAATLEPFSTILYETILDIEKAVSGEETTEVGLPTGFPNLDRVLGYWIPQDLIIIASRPGMGKSALAISMCIKQADIWDIPSAFFSLEMSKRSLVERVIAQVAELGVSRIRFRKLEPFEMEQLVHKSAKAGDYQLWLIDNCYSIQSIKTKCRRLVDECGVKLIVIDYLQIVKADQIENKRNSNREQEISYISRELKLLAKELNVPIIALSQLSRAVEARAGDKRPRLSDLRESGSLEQDADIVIFLYRPEYYGITQDEKGEDLVSGYCEAIIAKNRNGEIDMALLKFIGKFTTFVNYDKDSLQEKINRQTSF